MRLRSASLASLLGLAIVIAGGMPVRAAAARTSFNAVITVWQQGQPERQWVDEEGILRIRGQRFTDDVSGDLIGTQVSLANIDIDLATGNGTGEASFRLATNQGTWDGHLSGQITHGSFKGQLEGRNASDGTTIHATFVQTRNNPQTFAVTGSILDPN